MKKILGIGLISMLVLICATIAIGFGGPRHDCFGPAGHGGPHGPHNPMMKSEMVMSFFTDNADEIGLSKEQLQSIQKVVDGAGADSSKVIDELTTLHQQMRTEMEKTSPDRDLVTTLCDDINRLQGELMKINVLSHLDIKTVLTEEQHEIVKKLHREMGHSMHHGNRHRFRGGDPDWGTRDE